MRRYILVIGLGAAGCPANDPGASDGGSTTVATEQGSETATTVAMTEGPASVTDETSAASDATSTGPGRSGSTEGPGLECLGENETLATAFVRVQPSDRSWVAPEGTTELVTFACAPAEAAAGGVIDLVCDDDTRSPTEPVRFEVVTNLPALEVPIFSILEQAQVSMTFQAAATDFGPAGTGWVFSITSLQGELLALGQSAVSAPRPGTVLPFPELG